jgi:NAD(P)-dependent dehydrogenase (short-subunit alcohol dehydrogenase family)
VADTTDPSVAAKLIDRIAAEVGPPAVLVNTIGAFRPGDALTTTPETLRLMIDVNLGPALWLSRAVAPHMRQGSGAIVHVAARPGLEPAGGMAAYSVSKAALAHLTRTLDIELRPHGIRVNAVAPQLLDTPHKPGHIPGPGDGQGGRAGDDRRRDRIPGQRRRRAGQRSSPAGLRRLRAAA